MGVVPVRYGIELSYFTTFPVHIAIFHMDGHIAVSHGATEMGQGLNTKVNLMLSFLHSVGDVCYPFVKILARVKPNQNSFLRSCWSFWPSLVLITKQRICANRYSPFICKNLLIKQTKYKLTLRNYIVV